MFISKLKEKQKEVNKAKNSWASASRTKLFGCADSKRVANNKRLSAIQIDESECLEQIRVLVEKINALHQERDSILKELNSISDLSIDSSIEESQKNYERLLEEKAQGDLEYLEFQKYLFKSVHAKLYNQSMEVVDAFVEKLQSNKTFKEDFTDDFILRLKFSSPKYRLPLDSNIIKMVSIYNKMEFGGMELNSRNSRLDIEFKNEDFKKKYLKNCSKVEASGVSGIAFAIVLTLIDDYAISFDSINLDEASNNFYMADNKLCESYLKKLAGVGSNTIRAHYFKVGDKYLSCIPSDTIVTFYSFLLSLSKQFNLFELYYSVA